MEEDSVSNADNVPVVDHLLTQEQKLKQFLTYDRVNLVFAMVRDVPKKKIRKSLTLIAPAASVPLYFTPSILMNHVNGEVLSMLGAVNTLSLDAFRACNNIDITALTKIPYEIMREMFTRYAQDVTTFGTLKTTRIMIPVLDMNLGEEFKRSYTRGQ